VADAERRRSTDPWLEKLFDQNEEQHKQNRGDAKEMRDLIHALAMKDENHSGRISSLELWREKTVDPFLVAARDGISQAKGAGKAAKALYAAMGLVGGGVLYKVGAAFIAALPK
jgi:hypothetical protein